MPALLGQAALHAVELALLLSIPFAFAGLLASLLAGLFHAFFGADDPHVQHLPRLLLVGGAVVLFASAVARVVVEFAYEVLLLIGDG